MRSFDTEEKQVVEEAPVEEVETIVPTVEEPQEESQEEPQNGGIKTVITKVRVFVQANQDIIFSVSILVLFLLLVMNSCSDKHLSKQQLAIKSDFTAMQEQYDGFGVKLDEIGKANVDIYQAIGKVGETCKEDIIKVRDEFSPRISKLTDNLKAMEEELASLKNDLKKPKKVAEDKKPEPPKKEEPPKPEPLPNEVLKSLKDVFGDFAVLNYDQVDNDGETLFITNIKTGDNTMKVTTDKQGIIGKVEQTNKPQPKEPEPEEPPKPPEKKGFFRRLLPWNWF